MHRCCTARVLLNFRGSASSNRPARCVQDGTPTESTHAHTEQLFGSCVAKKKTLKYGYCCLNPMGVTTSKANAYSSRVIPVHVHNKNGLHDINNIQLKLHLTSRISVPTAVGREASSPVVGTQTIPDKLPNTSCFFAVFACSWGVFLTNHEKASTQPNPNPHPNPN